MSMLVLGLILFLGVHSVSIVSEGWRDRWWQSWVCCHSRPSTA